MNRSQIIRAISQDTSLPQGKVADVINALTLHVTDAIQAGETVDLHGLCKFKVELRPARTGRNPATGAEIEISAKNVVKVIPAKALSDAANN